MTHSQAPSMPNAVNQHTNSHNSTMNANILDVVLNNFKNWYDDSDDIGFKEVVLYGILFSGVIDNNVENVRWALNRGANVHENMSALTYNMLIQLGYRI